MTDTKELLDEYEDAEPRVLDDCPGIVRNCSEWCIETGECPYVEDAV